jgi:hypothetical protein
MLVQVDFMVLPDNLIPKKVVFARKLTEINMVM